MMVHDPVSVSISQVSVAKKNHVSWLGYFDELGPSDKIKLVRRIATANNCSLCLVLFCKRIADLE
jgi:hypothetical protein